jgi:hypothetical protein
MRASEFITEEELAEHELIWSRSGGELKLKWRCTSGLKKGRIVPDASVCGGPKDMAKSNRMKRTRANTKVRQAKKAKRTKSVLPASKLLALLNKQSKSVSLSAPKAKKPKRPKHKTLKPKQHLKPGYAKPKKRR